MKLLSRGLKHTLYDDEGFVLIITRTKSIVTNFMENKNGRKEEELVSREHPKKKKRRNKSFKEE
jgi:hypothetical protein